MDGLHLRSTGSYIIREALGPTRLQVESTILVSQFITRGSIILLYLVYLDKDDSL